jgi:hypothetical protein
LNASSDSGHQVRAVDQRQPLLGAEDDRLQPGRAQRLAARQPLAAVGRLPLSHQHQAEVRERREVPG